mgnify:CR=1 FL=1
MSSHVIPLKIYWGIFALLILLTGVTVGVAYIDLGPFNLFVALGVAGLKATLVVLYFMHVKYSERLIGLFVVGGVFWLVIMLVFLLVDYMSRGWLEVQGW